MKLEFTSTPTTRADLKRKLTKGVLFHLVESVTWRHGHRQNLLLNREVTDVQTNGFHFSMPEKNATGFHEWKPGETCELTGSGFVICYADGEQWARYVWGWPETAPGLDRLMNNIITGVPTV